MATLLIWLAGILAIVAVLKLAKVFQLAAEIRGLKQYEITDEDNRLNGRLMMVFMVAFFVFCFWQLYKYSDKMLPVAASDQGKELDWLFNFNMVIIGIVFVITNIFLFYFAYKYAGKKGTKAYFFPQNHKLELVWTVVPGVALAVIIFFGISLWSKITAVPDSDMLTIELYAKQFDWTARYAGKDNVLGASNYKKITDLNITGMDSTDQNAWDDIIVKNEFHIPVGKPVHFICHSRDVIHSAYLPHFRAQMNCVPGMTTQMHFTPTITTDSMRSRPDMIKRMEEINAMRVKDGKDPVEFDYILLCNKVCGASHYNMQMNIVVESQEKYEQWIAAKKPFFSKEVVGESVPAVKMENKELAVTKN